MRALFVVVGVLLLSSVTHAGPKRVAVATPVKAKANDKAKAKAQRKDKAKPKPKCHAQSFGAPWAGSLERSTKFEEHARWLLRRPHRTFATRTTVGHTRRAILDTFESFPKAHRLAIGDFSVARGGRISEHNSHQSGRDVDLGLFYKKQPAGYPASFVSADKDTLHVAAMWSLIANLASTQKRDGGVHMMFLDFELQGVIYNWAKSNEVSVERLNRIFQYPHGRGAAAGLIRHEPGHKDHLHVRFKCAAADTSCR